MHRFWNDSGLPGWRDRQASGDQGQGHAQQGCGDWASGSGRQEYRSARHRQFAARCQGEESLCL